MKKYLSLIFIAGITICLSGCRPNDDYTASALDGYWEGEIGQSFCSWRGYKRVYQKADIQFYADPRRYAEGKGVEYDYYSDYYTYDYVENYFTFSVHNNYIYLDYEYGQDVVIPYYSLNGNTFSGQFYRWVRNSSVDAWNVGEKLADFTFYRVDSWLYDSYDYTEYYYWTRSNEQSKWKKIDNPLKDNSIEENSK